MLMNRTIMTAAILSLAALGFSGIAPAGPLPGYYAGIQAGYGKPYYTANNTGTTSSSNITDRSSPHNVAGRLFAGYEFTPNWAAEFGLDAFSVVKVNNIGGVQGNNGTISHTAFDLVGKGILPLTNLFSAYAKAGAAYVQQDPSGALPFGTRSQIDPTFGAGVSYDLTTHVPVDLSWTRIQSTNGSSIPSSDLFAVGIAYNFG